jgi:serine/threonine protein kinase
VHRAKERGIEGFERIVALKRLLPHLAEDASFVKSFVREAKFASMLQHANIVQLYELGRVGSTYYISMEHIDGRDVRRILHQARRAAGPPNINVALSLLIQLCDALEYAHTRCDEHGGPLGLVHRDVSPSNLLVTRSGHLKVIDFGIAKAQSQQLLTQDGKVKGKLAYMATWCRLRRSTRRSRPSSTRSWPGRWPATRPSATRPRPRCATICTASAPATTCRRPTARSSCGAPGRSRSIAPAASVIPAPPAR